VGRFTTIDRVSPKIRMGSLGAGRRLRRALALALVSHGGRQRGVAAAAGASGCSHAWITQ
jgi:hypothetical protein